MRRATAWNCGHCWEWIRAGQAHACERLELDEPSMRDMLDSYQAPDLDDVVPARHLRRRMLERLDEACEDDI